MTILAFNDVNFTPVPQNDNQIWLTSKDLAKALGYSRTDKVTQIYNRNSDEFTKNMTATVDLCREPQNEGLGNLLTKTRIFSLRGCHLIAMFAKTKVAKDFRKWVLDVLERDQRTTSKQREIFITACDKLSINNKLRSKVYTDVANHFGYEKPVDMPIDILPEAIAYVYEELLAQEKARKSSQISHNTQKKVTALVAHTFKVYNWFDAIKPAFEVIAPDTVKAVHSHIHEARTEAWLLNNELNLGVSKNKLTESFNWGLGYNDSHR